MTTELRPSAIPQSLLRGSRIIASAVQQYGRTVRLKRDQAISAHQDTPESIYFIEGGFTLSKKMIGDGRQQTIAMSVPGDIIDYEVVTIGEVFSTTYALTETSLMAVSIEDFSRVIKENPIYESLFMLFVTYQGVLAKEWLVRIGCLSALERTAHFVCELFWRMELAGYSNGNYCEIALNQKELADILGISLVHQNKSLKTMRERGLLTWSKQGFHVDDRQRLEKFAHFNPAYITAAFSKDFR